MPEQGSNTRRRRDRNREPAVDITNDGREYRNTRTDQPVARRPQAPRQGIGQHRHLGMIGDYLTERRTAPLADEDSYNDAGYVEESGLDNDDNDGSGSGSEGPDIDVVAGEKRKRGSGPRKRKTKAEKLTEVHEDLIRNVTDFPPEMKIKSRKTLRVQGLQKVAAEENFFSTEVPELDSHGIDGLHKMNHVQDRYYHRQNRTDLRGYEQEQQVIGIDIDDVPEYEAEPVLWSKRDEYLKANVDFEGSQRFANPIALGHATTNTSTYRPADTSAGSVFVPIRAYGPLFEEGDNEVDRGAVVATNVIGAEDVEEVRRETSAIRDDRQDAGQPFSASDERTRTVPAGGHFLLLPRTERPLDWDHATDWAKTLRMRFQVDFFDEGSDELDEQKILRTTELPPSAKLTELDVRGAQIKEEEDDRLFVLLPEQEEVRQRTQAELDKQREMVKRDRETAFKLLNDLRACVQFLINQREEAHRRNEWFLAASGASVLHASRSQTPLSIRTSVPKESKASTDPDMESDIVIVRDDSSRPLAETLLNHAGAQPNNDRAKFSSDDDDDAPTGAALRRDDAFQLSNSHTRGNGEREQPNRNDVHAQSKYPRGPKPEQSRHHGNHRGPPRGPRTGKFTPRGDSFNGRGRRGGRANFQSRGKISRQKSQRPSSQYNWGAGNDKDSPADPGYTGWNPNADELDPIKKQFGNM